MIELVTGWLSRASQFISVGKVIFNQSRFRIEDKEGVLEEESRSKQGYRFEHEELKRLMHRLRNYETVSFTDAFGAPIKPETIDQRWGADGGIDCIIHIVARTERGACNVQGRIRNIIIKGDY